MKGLRRAAIYGVAAMGAVAFACGNSDATTANGSTSGTPTNDTSSCSDLCAKVAGCGFPSCASDCPTWSIAQRLCLSDTPCDHARDCEVQNTVDASPAAGDCTKAAVVSDAGSCPVGCTSASLDSESYSLCVPAPTQTKADGGIGRCPAGYAAESSDTCRKTCSALADCGDAFYTACRESTLDPDASTHPLFCY